MEKDMWNIWNLKNIDIRPEVGRHKSIKNVLYNHIDLSLNENVAKSPLPSFLIIMILMSVRKMDSGVE